jgi:hypothetical protein
VITVWVALLTASLLGLALAAITLAPRSPFVWRQASFPEDVTVEQVEAFLRQTAALRQGPVCLVLRADLGRLQFWLGAPESAIDVLVAAAGGILPHARFDEPSDLAAPISAPSQVWAARIKWRGAWPLLRTDTPELTAAGLLGAMAGLAPGDQLEWRLRVWPVGRVHRPAARSERSSVPPNPWFLRPWWPAQPPSDELRPIRQKYSDLLIRTELLVVASAETSQRAAAVGHRVVVAARIAGGVRGILHYQSRVARQSIEHWQQRRRPPLPWEPSTLLSPAEAVGLTSWPIEAPSIPGLDYGVGPRLLPPHDLPTAGRVFATSTFPATEGRRLAQPIEGALQHTAVVGPTGSGKSTLICNLVAADIRAGRGAFVLDLKGDLITEILGQIAPHRQHEVVVLEPGRGGPQPGLQLFPRGGDVELTSDLVLSSLSEIFHDSWGIRSSQYLGMGLRTLATLPGATLTELPLLFSDRAFRTRALSGVTDPWLEAGWQRFAALSEADQAAQLSSPLTKLSELVGRARLRLVLGQADSKLDFREVLAQKRIVLVSLPPGLLGMPATKLMSALCLWQFFQAVEGRASLPPERRSPFMAYIDEVAVLASLLLPLESILERARGHGVGLTLSPQALGQLSPALKASLLANAGSLVSFAPRSDDEAKLLARSLGGVTPEQLMHLGRYEVAMRLSLGPGSITRTMTGRSCPPDPRASDPDKIRALAAERYGQTIEAIDGELARRHEPRRASQAAVDEERPALGIRRRPR